MGQLLWNGLSGKGVSTPQLLCARAHGQAPSASEPTALAFSQGGASSCSLGPTGAGAPVNAFWNRRLRREPDAGNLHVRFNEGERCGGHWPAGLSSHPPLATLLRGHGIPCFLSAA